MENKNATTIVILAAAALFPSSYETNSSRGT